MCHRETKLIPAFLRHRVRLEDISSNLRKHIQLGNSASMPYAIFAPALPPFPASRYAELVSGGHLPTIAVRGRTAPSLYMFLAATPGGLSKLCISKIRRQMVITLHQIHIGSHCATERVHRYFPAKVELKKSHFGKQFLTECALRHLLCQSEFAEAPRATKACHKVEKHLLKQNAVETLLHGPAAEGIQKFRTP